MFEQAVTHRGDQGNLLSDFRIGGGSVDIVAWMLPAAVGGADRTASVFAHRSIDSSRDARRNPFESNTALIAKSGLPRMGTRGGSRPAAEVRAIGNERPGTKLRHEHSAREAEAA